MESVLVAFCNYVCCNSECFFLVPCSDACNANFAKTYGDDDDDDVDEDDEEEEIYKLFLLLVCNFCF